MLASVWEYYHAPFAGRSACAYRFGQGGDERVEITKLLAEFMVARGRVLARRGFSFKTTLKAGNSIR